MKRFTRIGLVAAAALAAQAAQAQQPTPNDILLAFKAPSVANDYIIDLGQYSSVVGAAWATPNTAYDLSSSFSLSTYNSTFSGAAAGTVTMAALGGSGVGVGADSFLTQLRAGSPAFYTAGSSLGGQTTVAQSQIASLANTLNYGVIPQGNSSSWTTVYPTFVSQVNLDPTSPITGTTIQEDLYQEVNAYVGTGRNKVLQGTWVYEGYFSLDTGAGTLSFTAVPEPSFYGAVAGAGLLALSLRRQLRRKQS